MKTVGLVWMALGFAAILAGCSASASHPDEQVAEAHATPEWARETAPTPDSAVAQRVLPIPETPEQTELAPASSIVKPFPEEDGAPSPVRNTSRTAQAN